MPSESTNSLTGLPEALRPHVEAFHTQVALASEEVREWHLHHEDAVADPAGVLAAELGIFAEGRIDTARMASVVGVKDAPDPILHHVMWLAEERFAAVASAGDDAFRVVLSPGGDLRDAVRDALADLGRVFAMGRAVQKARAHSFRPDDDYLLLHPWPFHRWAPSEKAMAPPLFIEVEGTDLRAAGLAEFLDGHVRIVLRVRSAAPPAALARLVSPGVFVAQVVGDGATELAELAENDGPGVVAVFEPDSGALPFVAEVGGNVRIEAGAIAAAIERVSDERGQPGMLDLRHLQGLLGSGAAASDTATAVAEAAAEPPAPATPVADAAPAAPTAPAVADTAPAAEVDRLAAWLLSKLPDDPGA